VPRYCPRFLMIDTRQLRSLAAAALLSLHRVWTQPWTQWAPYAGLLDTTEPNERQRFSLNFHTEPHSTALGPMKWSVFQDRCLKPLGHPSILATSEERMPYGLFVPDVP